MAGPLRGELLGLEKLAKRARLLARSQQLDLAPRRSRRAPLLTRLDQTRSILADAVTELSESTTRNVDVGPAGAWLLDNYHVVEENIREVRESLPRGYYRELPQLDSGRLAGYPRVYELAITLISHTEGRVDLDNADLFIGAFQEVEPLSIGELWAIPAMLRLALIESVRRMTLRTLERLAQIEEADRRGARILDAAELPAAVLDFERDPPSLTPTFVTRFLHFLREGRAEHPSLIELERWIGAEGLAAEGASAQATHRVAITQVMMANSITSLRAIARLDWMRFVERQSALDEVLRDDPSGFYSRMTFATRDHYRRVVERIARRTGRLETDVARHAVALSARPELPAHARHVGYHLVDGGLADLERHFGFRARGRERLHRLVLRHPHAVFGGAIAGVTGALLGTLWVLTMPSPGLPLLIAALLVLLPVLNVAIDAVNQLFSALLPPRLMPKLDLSGGAGLPEEYRTAVVVPTLLPDLEAVAEILERIEAHFLANRDAHLHFAILSDFTDAGSAECDGDDEIVAAAAAGIAELNARYAAGDTLPFLLFHRPRLWNPAEGVWMGWERKRGKLKQFNAYLRGGSRTAFSKVVGATPALERVRYVITLDADTVLPPDAATLLVGTLAHPLNRAVYDDANNRIERGFGILQPHVGVSLPSAYRSRFAAIHSGHPGVDPYTTAVSNLYQDLFGEGSFTGKGIYEIDTFERATRGRFPENTLLSHDLIEGSYARAGLASDIELYDDYPTHYLTFTRRKHRWIRGDWQLLRWLAPTVPVRGGTERNRLPLLSRWKIFDNLRRSGVEISQFVLLVAGWTLLAGSPLVWTLIAVGTIVAPWLVSIALAAVRPPLDKSWAAYYAAVGRDARTSVQQAAITMAFLPHQAVISADAIFRAVWRVFVSRRLLLQWQTASRTELLLSGPRRSTWRIMLPAFAAILGAGALTAARALLFPGGAAVVIAALPFLLLWLASPAIADALAAAPKRESRALAPQHVRPAMRYALLHWRYFDRFVGSATNGLVPDNHQEDPAPVTALRTSPTNIGLQLLSTVSAYDLGFITAEDMTARLEAVFRALARMARYEGHFYNWYGLEDLHVLEPRYVSTVDSGNLAGHLIALRQALLAITQTSAAQDRWTALGTGLDIACERLDRVGNADRKATPQARQAVHTALAHVHHARLTLLDASRSTSASASAASIAAPLHAAQQALHAAVDSPGLLAGAREWVDWCAGHLATHTGGPTAVADRLDALAAQASEYALAMNFRFLYDARRKLFAIGYHTDSHTRDASYYDLLASEARLASFIAIAKNDVPVEHWFHLGRSLSHASGATALQSWSGSMFEYLMPALIMQSWPETLLDQTYRGAVRRQIASGRAHAVPWGESESAYAVRDRHATYQYRAFGVADLGLKHGLDRDLVVAPYASALALVVEPARAMANLAVLEGKGALGAYGFCDALDYTRAPAGGRYTIVRTYMAHHIGMTLVALTGSLRANLWHRRFHADPMVRAVELLLHERIPRRLVLAGTGASTVPEVMPDAITDAPAVREFESPDSAQPHIALLGQLPYTVMVGSAGAGYSRFEDLAVTRWRSDATTNNMGQFCYIKDLQRAHVWSAAHQPVCEPADWYRAVFAADRVTFHRADGGIETRTEIAIVPEDSAEVRRITVTNTGKETRDVELTSYGEVVLAPPEAERAHPAFANLFVETEFHEWCSAITATRRPRSAAERALVCVHVVATGRAQVGKVTCETDRARFLGRGRTTRDALALDIDGDLSGTTGAVLDPIFALRTRVRLRPGKSAIVAFTTLVAGTRERAFELADRYHTLHASQRALDLAWTSAQVELQELDISPADASVFQELAGHLLYGSDDLGPRAADRDGIPGSQPLLWSAGISGDRPILLADIDSAEGLPTLRQIFSAHHYWRRRGMHIDLVVLNRQSATYFHELDDSIAATLAASMDAGVLDQSGGVFLRRRDILADDVFSLLRATARVQLTCDGRSLGQILATATHAPVPVQPEVDTPNRRAERQETRTGYVHRRARTPEGAEPGHAAVRERRHPLDLRPAPDSDTVLLCDNGHGGVAPGGEYVIRVRGDFVPPAPWSNVVANPFGGFLVTERGTGYTWAANAHFYRLTPWHNDPVSDPPGDAIYLQDEESGTLWSPAPAPAGSAESYIVRHRTGGSSFEHVFDGIESELTLGMADGAAVRVSTLRLTNRGGRPRTLRLTAYAEWTLGALREQTRAHIHTRCHPDQSTIYASNGFTAEFAGWAAFCTLSEPLLAHTSDRLEFLGYNGTVADPIALRSGLLSGATGSGRDPCAALQCRIVLAPGATHTVVVLLGAAESAAAASALVDRYRQPAPAAAALTASSSAWQARLSVVAVETPDPTFDAMINTWSLYQALSCRMWARTGFYQSSGAYGFRDQLQDVMAFVYAEPGVAREHILRAAARQFGAGDVQHWWHPESGRGVRTRFSDDLVWLAYVTEHYTRVTGDTGILDEDVPFLEMRPLAADEQEIYDTPTVSAETASLYEHCRRALRRACTRGVHGLPLIGAGDWNDGMNRVGVEGAGESVWLAWFLIATLRSFAGVAEGRADAAAAAGFRAEAERYVTAVEDSGWDGAWYRRAYFDDGTPLGSAENDECRIDAVAQSWSVISGAAAPGRQRQAMASLQEHLVDDQARIIRLLAPPFDKTPKDPGYIKGYLPGVRENGAQYTHAALWTVLATAQLGDDDRAFELFQMINPLTRAANPDDAHTYKVEPYVVAADVYTARGQLSRGGWTWYTGSASWLYRIGLETILGFVRRGASLEIHPHVPAAWPGYAIEYRFGSSIYRIEVVARDGDADTEYSLDGVRLQTAAIPLIDDGTRHTVGVATYRDLNDRPSISP